jgi:hypothetical protein
MTLVDVKEQFFSLSNRNLDGPKILNNADVHTRSSASLFGDFCTGSGRAAGEL